MPDTDRRDARPARRRRAAVVLLLIVGTVLVPAALVGNWVRSTLFETSGYVDAVAPLADDPTVQRTVTDTITTALLDETDLPSRTITVLRPLVRTSVEKVVATSTFARVWRTTNRVAHEQIRLFLTDKSRFLRSTDGTVGIPVGALLGPVRAAIVRDLPSGVRELLDRTPATSDAELVLIDSPALARVQTVLAVANRAGQVLPLAAAATMLTAIAIAPRRRSTIFAAGTLIAGSGALVLGGVLLVRAVVVARAPDDQRDLLGAIAHAVTGPLLHQAGLVAAAGLLITLAAVVVRRIRPAS